MKMIFFFGIFIGVSEKEKNDFFRIIVRVRENIKTQQVAKAQN